MLVPEYSALSASPSVIYNSVFTDGKITYNDGFRPSVQDNFLVVLKYLLLKENSFNRTIPPSLASLKGLQYLDVSKNQLSGSIPDVLQNISGLKHLNVSFNVLEGEVPTYGVFRNATQVVMIENNKLCGGISQMLLPACSVKDMKQTKHHKFMLVVVGVLFLLTLSIFLTVYWMRKRNQKRSFDSPIIDQLEKVSYRDLHQGTDGFSITNLIGSGSFVDYSFKPSNVLLDDEMIAHVSDFGIARLVSNVDGSAHNDTSTIVIIGTVGYAPPDYGMGSKVSTCGDMYSFGILLLEILTGRRPTNEVFEDGQNLHNFVPNLFPNNIMNILEPGLVSRYAGVETQDGNCVRTYN
ncbi:unnamed protein product [Vicia faba]|uniref:Protein kinase domain-containing protein n=1 Tax=Vicia faba TaxID=3906 RepID=A0AAV0YQX5_VICFA|nr:unnamed protein product [Vicia faba]